MHVSGFSLAGALAVAALTFAPQSAHANLGVAVRQRGTDADDINVGPHAPPSSFTSSPSSGVSVSSVSSKPSKEPGKMRDYILSRVIKFWHGVVVDALQEDYSHEGQEPEANGPCYSSRVNAIVHIAIHDAYVGITREGDTYGSYDQEAPGAAKLTVHYKWSWRVRNSNGGKRHGHSRSSSSSMHSQLEEIRLAYSAIAQAAHDTLVYAFPRQEPALKRALETYFRSFFVVDEGKEWGAHVAKVLIASRDDDGHDSGPTFVEPPPGPYALWEHRPDPTITPAQPLYVPHWGNVEPFGFTSIDGAVSPMPDPKEESYIKDFKAVRSVGERESDTRTHQETTVGLFWAYDGAYKIGTPIRLFLQVVDAIVEACEKDDAHKKKLRSAHTLATLYAATSVSMADAAIQAWHEKYKHNFWRPVVGIREAGSDGYAETHADPEWVPLGSPLTNTIKMSVTPAFPSYPSGHATIGTAGMKTAQMLLDLDDGFEFQFMSSEMDGEARDMDGSKRPAIMQTLTVPGAVEQNKVARVYLGVHWHFDCSRGSELGEAIASKVSGSFPHKA